MWQVDNKTPFATLGYFVRDRDGFEHWVVALRATFNIRDDGLVALSETQESVHIAPAYADDKAKELLAESDIAPFKPKVDLTVSGAAVAVNQAPFRELPISLTVGNFEKKAVAFGRRWLKRKGGNAGWSFEASEQTITVPLSWSMALGGADAFGGDKVYPLNPIGKGWSANYDDIRPDTPLELAQIEDPTHPFDVKRLPSPVGFGAIQPGWQPRLVHAGTYDGEWERGRAPLLPLDFSEQFHQAAPPDQILDIKGGEPVTVVGLHAEGPYTFMLPQIIFEAVTRMGMRHDSHRLRLIGVHIEATKKRLSMIWNGSLPCSDDMSVDGSMVMFRQMAGVRLR